jgi:hypothetical protein
MNNNLNPNNQKYDLDWNMQEGSKGIKAFSNNT